MYFLLRNFGKISALFLAFCCLGSGLQANPGVMQTKLRRIVIDPGHGGAAAGAVGHNGTREKDVVLDVAILLGKLIEEQLPDVKVFYTRTSDVEVDLAQRGKLANQHKADLFISIHANSNKSRSESASGTETYVMGLDKSDNNLAVARRENAAILSESDYSSKYEGYDPNSPESFILFSLLFYCIFLFLANFYSWYHNQK
jgi:N-acetylmuramoyl-L-alanine amidase